MSALFLFVALGHCFQTAAIVLLDLCRFVRLAAYSRSAVVGGEPVSAEATGALPA
jgi:hypothetical protein